MAKNVIKKEESKDETKVSKTENKENNLTNVQVQADKKESKELDIKKMTIQDLSVYKKEAIYLRDYYLNEIKFSEAYTSKTYNENDDRRTRFNRYNSIIKLLCDELERRFSIISKNN